MASDRPSAAKDAAADGGRAEGLNTALAGGGILAALGIASCCLLPFALFTLGISGAWISNLTALEAYQPIFVAAAAALLAAGFWRVYGRPRAEAACRDQTWCARPASHRVAKIGLWTAAVLVGLGLAFPHVAAPFLRAYS